MAEEKKEPKQDKKTAVDVPEPIRKILARLVAIEQEGQAMQERVQATVAIEMGKLAGTIKVALVGALVEAAGLPPGPCRIKPDCSEILPGTPEAK